MSFGNDRMENAACDCRETKIRSQTMTELMREASTLASEALYQTKQINAVLFADDGANAERQKEPACFLEELEKTKCDLNILCEELERLKNRLWPT